MIKFAKQSRRPLTLQAHKPIPIPSVIPHFNTAYSGRKDFSKTSRDDDKEGAKLRAQYKQERKGAIRELRKDNKFLASEQAKRQEEKDRSYNERMKKVEGSIQVERHEEKMMEREKKREKKRR
jgi:nucleolar protein 14